MNAFRCPHCTAPTRQHPDRSYYGEMRECTSCGFMAYQDRWGATGEFIPDNYDPF